MTKRMLIDATHAEETRVVVLDGSRLEDFDVETSGKKQLKGNIYLAKVVRVEPSLQAAFVEYGGNRHGFLAFGEIHPDYYQIPVADRERLIAMQAEAARAEQAAEEALDAAEARQAGANDAVAPQARMGDIASADAAPPEPSAEFSAPELAAPELAAPELSVGDFAPVETAAMPVIPVAPVISDLASEPAEPETAPDMAPPDTSPVGAHAEADAPEAAATDEADRPEFDSAGSYSPEPENRQTAAGEPKSVEALVVPEAPPQTIGGEADAADDARERRIPMQYLRNYKIQEVIRRRQILLVQVVKEERGTKGAALTTYISLAGRFCVLMPNSPRGGGISRKITSAADRRRLKEITAELEIPEGMGMIVRTAGANRPKPEIKRDCEYLLRLWDDVREQTMRSVAPALIHEEASLIKRAIRDVYSRDIEEILVDGDEGWRAARDFMRMLMPAHAQKVIAWRDATQPLFAKHAVEAQLDAMMGRNVQLRSGGYLVIDQTEALVSIDVNSGRSTRERGIEETALRTNLEAADEVARQLRLRDLAGLIVIDFIDMESKKHNAMVERRLQEALKADRARIQVGHISHFGLMEMSRQRLRPSLMEASLVQCPHCSGTGHVRSTESAAIHVLRGIEDEGARRRNAEIMVHVAGTIAMYILNHKRERLRMIEARCGLRVLFNADPALIPPQMRIEKLRALEPAELPEALNGAGLPGPLPFDTDMTSGDILADTEVEEAPDIVEADEPVPVEAATAEAGKTAAETAEARAEEENRRRRRRRRRGPRRDGASDGLSPLAALGAEQPDLEAIDALATTPVFIPDPEPAPHVEVTASEVAGTGPDDLTPAEPVADAEPVAVAAPEPAPEPAPELIVVSEDVPVAASADADHAASPEAAPADEEGEPKTRRRGRRGGRRRRREDGEEAPAEAEPVVAAPYIGPTPADPFGNPPFDIFDAMEQAEQARMQPAQTDAAPAVPAAEPEPAPPSMPNGLHLVETLAEPPPPPEPLVRPVLIDAPAAERKRGWWRR